MGDQMASLESLLTKYAEEIKDFQDKFDEAKKRYLVVSEALELLKKDGYTQQERLFPDIISDKYKDISMTDAIKDIIQSNLTHRVSASEVFTALKKHGYQSKSKSMKRDVYVRLYRLRKNEKLICRTEKGIKKYYLPETKE